MDPLLPHLAATLAAEPELGVAFDRIAERLRPWIGRGIDADDRIREVVERHPDTLRYLRPLDPGGPSVRWAAEEAACYETALKRAGLVHRPRVTLLPDSARRPPDGALRHLDATLLALSARQATDGAWLAHAFARRDAILHSLRHEGRAPRAPASPHAGPRLRKARPRGRLTDAEAIRSTTRAPSPRPRSGSRRRYRP